MFMIDAFTMQFSSHYRFLLFSFSLENIRLVETCLYFVNGSQRKQFVNSDKLEKNNFS